jgi:hypothetical protein
MLPTSVSVMMKENIKKLTDFNIRVLNADVSHHYSPTNTTNVPENIRINASVLGPKLYTSQCYLKSLKLPIFVL